MTIPTRNKKPPAAPPAMGAILFEDDFGVGVCCEETTEVWTAITVGGGVVVEVIVTTVTTPLPSVDDCSAVTTVGGGVVVCMTIVGEGCGAAELEDCDDVKEEGMVLIGVLESEQLAKSVEVGLTTVTMLVTIRGSVKVETLPVLASMSCHKSWTNKGAMQKYKAGLPSTYHLVESAQQQWRW